MRIRCVSPDIGSRVESSQKIRSETEKEKERIRDRVSANCSNQRVGRVSRTEGKVLRKEDYIRDTTTGFIYRRGTIEHYGKYRGERGVGQRRSRGVW